MSEQAIAESRREAIETREDGACRVHLCNIDGVIFVGPWEMTEADALNAAGEALSILQRVVRS
jgi:hypothetical protein